MTDSLRVEEINEQIQDWLRRNSHPIPVTLLDLLQGLDRVVRRGY